VTLLLIFVSSVYISSNVFFLAVLTKWRKTKQREDRVLLFVEQCRGAVVFTDWLINRSLLIKYNAAIESIAIRSKMAKIKIKVKVRHLIQRCFHELHSWPEALYSLGSSSWLAWANGTPVHCATIHCRRQPRTMGPAMQHADIPPPRSANYCNFLQHVGRKLLIIFSSRWG